LQRHVEKHALDRCEAPVFFIHRAFDAELQRQIVLGESLCGVSMDVAAKLIDQNNQSQAAFGFGGPVIELSRARGVNIVAKLLFDFTCRLFPQSPIEIAAS